MKFFMRGFGHTQLYSNGILNIKFWTTTIIFKWDSILLKFFMRNFGHTQLYLVFILMKFLYEVNGHTQLYSNGILY